MPSKWRIFNGYMLVYRSIPIEVLVVFGWDVWVFLFVGPPQKIAPQHTYELTGCQLGISAAKTTGMSCWNLVTILSKLGCNLLRGRNQPTYIGVVIYLLSSMDILAVIFLRVCKF